MPFPLHFLFLCTHQVTIAATTANTTTPPITAPIITHGGPSKTDYKMGQIAPKASVLPGIDPCFVTFKARVKGMYDNSLHKNVSLMYPSQSCDKKTGSGCGTISYQI